MLLCVCVSATICGPFAHENGKYVCAKEISAAAAKMFTMHALT